MFLEQHPNVHTVNNFLVLIFEEIFVVCWVRRSGHNLHSVIGEVLWWLEIVKCYTILETRFQDLSPNTFGSGL